MYRWLGNRGNVSLFANIQKGSIVLGLVSPHNVSLKVLRIIKVFFGKVRRTVVFFADSRVFLLGSLPSMPFLVSVSHEHWGQQGLEFFWCCLQFFCDKMSRRCTLRVILVSGSLLGRIATVLSFLHLWIIALTVVPVRVLFQTDGFKWLFPPHFFSNCFGLWHDALVLVFL